MDIQKQKSFIIKFLFYAILMVLLYGLLKYGIPLLMPFLLGLAVALILKPLIRLISTKLGGYRRTVAVILLLVFYALLGLFLVFCGSKLIDFLQMAFARLPSTYEHTLEPALNAFLDKIRAAFPGMNPSLMEGFANANESIATLITTFSSKAAEMITGIAGGIPGLLVKLLFMIVSSVFFTVDYPKISAFILRQFSEKNRKLLCDIKSNGIGTLFKFIRAYAILMSLTFVELCIGLLILRIPHPILLAMLIAIVDVLPVLGTGTVVIPWAVVCLVLGNLPLGIGLLVLYAIITVVRQLLEPKVVGQQIGLHPLITLICMFVGAQLFGVIGLFGLPIAATIIKNLNDTGTIHLFK